MSETQPSILDQTKRAFEPLRPYAQSKYPALALSGLFGVSAVVPRPALKAGHFPSFFHRVGFTAFFGFAAYALAEGDARNGSGIATAWSLAYFLMHAKRTFTLPPRNPLALAFMGGTAATACLYGTEYFMFQD